MTSRIPLRLVSFLFAWAIVETIATPMLHADAVVLTNGDKLTGTAIKLEEESSPSRPPTQAKLPSPGIR